MNVHVLYVYVCMMTISFLPRCDAGLYILLGQEFWGWFWSGVPHNFRQLNSGCNSCFAFKLCRPWLGRLYKLNFRALPWSTHLNLNHNRFTNSSYFCGKFTMITTVTATCLMISWLQCVEGFNTKLYVLLTTNRHRPAFGFISIGRRNTQIWY